MAAREKPKQVDVDHWHRILGSPFAGAYVSELYWLARDTVETCEQVFSNAEPPPPESSYIKVDHALHADIYRVLNNAARIRALVKERSRRADQSARQFAVQEKRTRWMRDLLDGLSTDAILQAQVRNSLEHFDEYLDETALRSSMSQIARPTLFPIDMTLGRDGTLQQFTQGVVYPVRVYLAEERMFVNCGKRIDVNAIALECQAITARLVELSPQLAEENEPSSEGRGSSMLVVTNDSFS